MLLKPSLVSVPVAVYEQLEKAPREGKDATGCSLGRRGGGPSLFGDKPLPWRLRLYFVLTEMGIRKMALISNLGCKIV